MRSAHHSLKELLSKTASFFENRGIASSRLDAELLLCAVLELERLQLYTSFDRPMTEEELDSYRALVARRAKHEPVAYILGEREFYGRPFSVDSRVLIPRPDTEVLVDEALERIPNEASGLVLDYGTGSGAIGLTLAAERPGLRVLCIDISRDALAVAKANAETFELRDRVGFLHSDGLSALPERFRGALLGLVANPPYIPEADRDGLMPDVRDHEPAQALFAPAAGLLHYERIASDAATWLAPSGFCSVEVGAGQAQSVIELFERAGWRDITVRSDLARHDRVVSATRP